MKESEAKVGARVVCVDDIFPPNAADGEGTPFIFPKFGVEYTIRDCICAPQGDCGLLLEEIRNAGGDMESLFRIDRFKLVQREQSSA